MHKMQHLMNNKICLKAEISKCISMLRTVSEIAYYLLLWIQALLSPNT